LHPQGKLRCETIEVYLPESPGPAYTKNEWDTDSSADWEVNDKGEWLFQGQPSPKPNMGVTIRRVETCISCGKKNTGKRSGKNIWTCPECAASLKEEEGETSEHEPENEFPHTEYYPTGREDMYETDREGGEG
jgi:hypothetical protein